MESPSLIVNYKGRRQLKNLSRFPFRRLRSCHELVEQGRLCQFVVNNISVNPVIMSKDLFKHLPTKACPEQIRMGQIVKEQRTEIESRKGVAPIMAK